MQVFWTYYIFSSIIAVNVSDKIAKHTYDWYSIEKDYWFFLKFMLKSFFVYFFSKKGEYCIDYFKCIICFIDQQLINLKYTNFSNDYPKKDEKTS